jgi:Shikimate dehydrogenase substrate binding domain
MEKNFRKLVRFGLIGADIQASRSPRLHECEARAAGIVCSYQLIDLAQLGVSECFIDGMFVVAKNGARSWKNQAGQRYVVFRSNAQVFHFIGSVGKLVKCD